MSLSYRRLNSDEELQVFLDNFCTQLARRSHGDLAISIPVGRIRHCTDVVGVFNGKGKMVAGYILNNDPNLVLLSVVPEDIREKWLAEVPLDDLCELNLIWRNEGIGHITFALRVWPHIISACVFNGRRYILGSGYDNPLNRWYCAVGPRIVYAGPSTTSQVHVYVYAYTRSKITATYLVSAVDNFLGKAFRHLRAS